MTRAQIEAVDKVRISENPSASVELAGGFRVRRAYDMLVFDRKAGGVQADSLGWKLTVMNRQEYCKFMEARQLETARQSAIAKPGLQTYGAFSGRVLETGAKPELRTRRDGDIISIKGGTKKLQDFFTDCKVPAIYRDEMLLLAVGNRVLWVMPSEHFPDERNRQKGRFSYEFRANPSLDETIIVLEKK